MYSGTSYLANRPGATTGGCCSQTRPSFELRKPSVRTGHADPVPALAQAGRGGRRIAGIGNSDIKQIIRSLMGHQPGVPHQFLVGSIEHRLILHEVYLNDPSTIPRMNWRWKR